MKFCHMCGTTLPDGARFCPMCGAAAVNKASDEEAKELCPADYIYAYPDREAEQVIIPEGIDRIEGGYQDMKKLTKITLPKSLKSIGAYSFSGCEALFDITLPDGLCEIDFVAFEGCSALTSIKIPASVRLIDLSAFGGCTSLSRAVFEDPSGWGIGAFMSEPKPTEGLSDPHEAAKLLLSHSEDTVSLVLTKIK